MMLNYGFKPYLLRAFYEYLNDKNLTPYIYVFVNDKTQVPLEYVVEDNITLNIGMNACPDIQIKQDYIHFHARFSGQVIEINIPIGHVLAIYARENTDLMLTFPLEKFESKPEIQDHHADEKIKHDKKENINSFLKIVKKNP